MSPARETSEPANNLPTRLSSFVGREDEMAQVRELLGTRRLLTLTGAGGCGKTRLAIQVASEFTDTWEDGVWLVELDALGDPALLPQTVASTLGVREQKGRTPTETLIEYLDPRRLLLVLDNCEHLVQAVAEFASTLLQSCPTLVILATSREPLGVDGEAIWAIPPMSLEHAEAGRSGSSHRRQAGALPRSEAVELFVARAAVAAPDFELTADNTAAVEEICSRLDGMPLAIELAAARLRALSVQDVAEHLDDRFHLLRGGSRTSPPRQQTLEATLDWSFALLSDTERMILRRLSAFAGGCSWPAAEAVCTGDGVTRGEVLEVLPHLVDKSLVQAIVQSSGGTRYRLLETIRQYVWQRLLESGEAPAVQARHARTFLEFAKQGVMKGTKFPSVVEVAAISRWEVEHDNFRAALAWSLSPDGDRELGMRMSSTLSQFWQMRGYLTEGRRWREALLADAQGVSADARAEAWSLAGHARIYDERIDDGEACFQTSLALYEELDDRAGAAWQRGWLSWVQVARADYEQAATLARGAAEVLRETGDDLGAAVALEGWGEAEYLQGHLSEARGHFEESLAAARELSNPYVVGRRLTRLGQVAHAQGNDEDAVELIEQGLTTCMGAGDNSGATMALCALAGVALTQGQAIRATRLLGAVASLEDQAGSAMWFLDRLEHQRSLMRARSQLPAAEFETAWRIGRSMSLLQAVDHACRRPDKAPDRRALKEEYEGLTEREREVAAWLAQGKSNREIAEAMTVGVRTVETYVTRMLNKLGFESRVQIATWAIEKGLAPPPGETQVPD
jgi:predicted ATPase/DNA-binding CsgD family transcriptional regulator